MHTIICPTVTARSADEYEQQMQRLSRFATRVHIDLADGIFTPVKLTPLKEAWWPSGMRADLHLMYAEPFRYTKELLRLRPHLIIVHAEADGDFMQFADDAHRAGIEVGVALKPSTAVDLIVPALDVIDHVLVFSGHLGHFGGEANTHLLTKVLQLKKHKPTIEVGWEGGVNNKNIAVLAAGGVNIINVGGYIQHAADPQTTFESLEQAIKAAPAQHDRLSHYHKRV